MSMLPFDSLPIPLPISKFTYLTDKKHCTDSKSSYSLKTKTSFFSKTCSVDSIQNINGLKLRLFVLCGDLMQSFKQMQSLHYQALWCKQAVICMCLCTNTTPPPLNLFPSLFLFNLPSFHPSIFPSSPLSFPFSLPGSSEWAQVLRYCSQDT